MVFRVRGRTNNQPHRLAPGRLRHKIETDAKEPELIKTVRGGGYVFTAAVTQDDSADT